MYTSILEPDAAYYRLQYYREVAHRRLVDEARAGQSVNAGMGARHSLHRALVRLGHHLRGITPPVPELALPVDSAVAEQANP